ncbi:hypothetical protein HQ403_03400 [Candidatus Kaiserbacteria bacterium]|nr:hypothetical protein [Candidatus Kaiserbacteria bacterium]
MKNLENGVISRKRFRPTLVNRLPKTMNKKYIFLFFLLLLLVVSVVVSINHKKSFDKILTGYGITFSNINDAQLVKNTDGNITATLDSRILKLKVLENLETKPAMEYIKGQVILFESLFKPQLPPYPEFLTRETGCGKKFLPIKKTGDNGDYFIVFAGQRFGFGICANDLIEYKASMKFLYCPNTKNVVRFEYFIPNGVESFDLDDMTESFRCL